MQPALVVESVSHGVESRAALDHGDEDVTGSIDAGDGEAADTGEVLYEIRGKRLSAFAGAAHNSAVVRRKRHRLKVSDLSDLPKQGYPLTEELIRRSQGEGNPWSREGVQNGIKAALKAGKRPKIEVRTRRRQFGNKAQFIGSVRDWGIGMDVYELVQFLLSLEESSFA